MPIKIEFSKDSLVKFAESVPASVLGMLRLGPEELEKLENKYFALVYKRRDVPIIRKFPIVDAGNTYLSALQWGLSSEALPDAARMVAAYFIGQAAQKFDLDIYPFKEDIISMAQGLTSIPVTNVITDDTSVANTLTKAAEHKRYLLPEKLAYPVDTEKEVKVASAYFDQWADRMPIVERRRYALNLYKRAEELGVGVGEWVTKNAATRRNPSFMAKVASRVDLTKEARLKLVWEKIASMADTMENDMLIDMVTMMDKVAGLDKYYGAVLQDPIQSVVTDSAEPQVEKVACDVTDEELGNVPYDVMKKYYGTDFASQFDKDRRHTYESLDDTNKNIIKKMILGLVS